MNLRYLAFTGQGMALAQRLAQALGGEAGRCGQPLSLREWTAQAFAQADALVFVGAVGIAVRAVAPHLVSKATDPAVVAVDERGQFAIPLAGGHLGGANRLAREIAAVCGAVPVITTATDVNGLFAVDSWAKSQGCAVLEPSRIKKVSAALLTGETVCCRSDFPVAGRLPAGVTLDEAKPHSEAFAVSVAPDLSDAALHIVPQAVILGVGCKKNTPAEELERAFQQFCAAHQLPEQAICGVATIDLKQKEPGLLAFCQRHGWKLRGFSAAQLRAVEGDFVSSAFVQSVTGVDNVCERAAVLGSGGTLLYPKQAGGGVTMAAGLCPVTLRWDTAAPVQTL